MPSLALWLPHCCAQLLGLCGFGCGWVATRAESPRCAANPCPKDARTEPRTSCRSARQQSRSRPRRVAQIQAAGVTLFAERPQRCAKVVV